MSYIGQGLPADTFQGFTTDKFTGDGTANKAFTLTKEPFSEDTILVTIDGVVQEPTDDFTVSGTTLTLVGTAANGSEVNVTHMGGPLPIGGAAELDLNGASDKLILDADGDTTISADTDDQIDFKIGGADAMSLGSDLTADVSGEINLDADGGKVRLKDGGTEVARFVLDNGSGDLEIVSSISDKDIKLKGNDGGSNVTALTLDMSEAGVATFNSSIITTGILNKVNNSLLLIGGGNATNTGSNLTMYGGSSGSAGTFRFRNGTTTHFNIAGNGDLTGTDQSIGSISDSRLKENITDFTYDVAKFKQFKPKTFDWKNPAEHNGRTNNRGFIAQEIAAIDDYWTDQITIDSDTEDAKLISADSDGNHNSYSLKLGKKDAMYISVIQQLITRIEALEDA